MRHALILIVAAIALATNPTPALAQFNAQYDTILVSAETRVGKVIGAYLLIDNSVTVEIQVDGNADTTHIFGLSIKEAQKYQIGLPTELPADPVDMSIVETYDDLMHHGVPNAPSGPIAKDGDLQMSYGFDFSQKVPELLLTVGYTSGSGGSVLAHISSPNKDEVKIVFLIPGSLDHGLAKKFMAAALRTIKTYGGVKGATFALAEEIMAQEATTQLKAQQANTPAPAEGKVRRK